MRALSRWTETARLADELTSVSASDTSSVDGRGEAGGQIGILGNQLLGIADQIELLGADGEYRIRSERECAHAVQLLDKQGAQLRVEFLRPCIEVIQATAQLESDHRKARLFADRRGLDELVENGGEAALRSLRRAVEHDPGREIAGRLRIWAGVALTRVVERAADLHLHDLEPGGEQPLRRLIGLEHRLQESGEALAGLEPLSHQGLELRQIGSQRGDQQLDRDRRIPMAVPTRPISVSPMMRRSTSGRIRLDISSRSLVVVTASRAGVDAISRSAAREISIELTTCGTRASISSSRSPTWRNA